MPKSTAPAKPAKPRPDFPLFPHATGRWAKKVRGKLEYFGKVSADPDGVAALNSWLDQKDDLLAGRRPRTRTGAATVAYLVNHYLTHKRNMLASNDLAQRTFDGYYACCSLIVATFGKNRSGDDIGPDDFADLRKIMATRWGPIKLGNEIQIVRSVFKHAVEAGKLKSLPAFGPGFRKPSAKTLRLLKAAAGPRLFQPEEIHAALARADSIMGAMLLLGINAALGNTDLALLPIKALDLKGRWLIYPRPKTGIQRRIPLWPETVAALEKHLAARREPKDSADAPLVFISQRGLNFIGKFKGYRVTAAMNRLMAEAKIEGRCFYDLRRTFQTIGERSRDLPAVRAIMGHAPPANDMSSVYRQEIDDNRLRAVANHVHAWLYPATPKKRKAK